MKRMIILTVGLLTWTSGHADYKTHLLENEPEHYRYRYTKQANGKIDESSVCREYSGKEWKRCRRYAQWEFSVKCWENGYRIRHKTGDVRQRIKQERAFFCDAKSRVTPLR